MTTAQHAREICHAIPEWARLSSLERAERVLEWCNANDVRYELNAVALEAGMRAFSGQSPANYLEFVQGYWAAHLTMLTQLVPLAGILLDAPGEGH